MKWLLTGDEFDVDEALRIGLVQEVVPIGESFERATQIADRISSAAPLGVQGTLLNAYAGILEGPLAAAEQIRPYAFEKIRSSKDVQEGIAAMFQKREPKYTGE